MVYRQPYKEMTEYDNYFQAAVILVVQRQMCNTSLIQRKFRIGYNRAGRIVNQLEEAGIVGKFKGAAPRDVLIKDIDSLEERLSDMELGEQRLSDPSWDNREWI
uniref:Ftsk gamma domain n=2 Tax=root TaxID=1 RepID=A0A8S5U983_9CAUD|nr:MAG TPA: Ftsk gamma domain [Siphoviridae sp. ct7aK2]